MSNRVSTIWKSIRSSFFWTLLVSLFGLAQFWIICLIALIDNRKLPIVEKSIGDGVLLFFLMALIITIAFDYWFDQDVRNRIQKKASWLDVVIMSIAPIVVGLFVSILYVFYLLEPQNVDIKSFSIVQIYAIIICVIYSWGIKFVLMLAPSWRLK